MHQCLQWFYVFSHSDMNSQWDLCLPLITARHAWRTACWTDVSCRDITCASSLAPLFDARQAWRAVCNWCISNVRLSILQMSRECISTILVCNCIHWNLSVKKLHIVLGTGLILFISFCIPRCGRASSGSYSRNAIVWTQNPCIFNEQMLDMA